ncbi:MAG: sigma-54 interaction domain-containing protein [Bryobacteraceae bacterium]
MTKLPQPQDSRVFLGMTAIMVSPVMRQLLAVVERAAQTQASVLIQGESGSGKELIARAVHHYSLRCSKPWVDVSCAALPEHLVESELFGYEKGAFSSADSPKPGLFELAQHGTLFLDEIGELEPRMQVKLLRVLDGVPYYRLGGVKKISVDVRIIAATNQDLRNMIATGGFRGDLYHRLEQISLRVPPLRERIDDIVPLAEYFLTDLRPGAFFCDEACSRLRAHSWPGNIRQLRNVVTKAAVLATGDEMRAQDLPLELSGLPLETNSVAIDRIDSPNLGAIERHTIMKVLEQTNGHQQRAADLLGISSRTLSRKLKIYESGAPRRRFAS